MASGRLTLFARTVLAVVIVCLAGALAWHWGLRRLLQPLVMPAASGNPGT